MILSNKKKVFKKLGKDFVAKLLDKKNCGQKKILAQFIFISLESSETYFDLFSSKIGTKLKNLIIYGDILVNFL